MMAGLAAVHARRAALLQSSAQLRAQMAGHLAALERPAAVADRARAWGQGLRARPAWLLLPAAALTVLVLRRPGRTLRWSLRLWGAWRLWHRVREQVQHARHALRPR